MQERMIRRKRHIEKKFQEQTAISTWQGSLGLWLSQRPKLSIYQSIFILCLTYIYESQSKDPQSRLWTQAWYFTHRVAGDSLQDSMRSLLIGEWLILAFIRSPWMPQIFKAQSTGRFSSVAGWHSHNCIEQSISTHFIVWENFTKILITKT